MDRIILSYTARFLTTIRKKKKHKKNAERDDPTDQGKALKKPTDYTHTYATPQQHQYA
jgi:hypothetical protein